MKSDGLRNIMTEQDDKKDIETRETKEYFQNVVIEDTDIGKTLYTLIEEKRKSVDKITNLSETEMKFLDDLIYNGYVVHQIHIKEGHQVTFRSVSSLAFQRMTDYYATFPGNDSSKQYIYKCLNLALHMESYGNVGDKLYLSHASKQRDEFEDIKAIEQRFEFVYQKLSSIIMNLLLERAIEFTTLLYRISAIKNVLNF